MLPGGKACLPEEAACAGELEALTGVPCPEPLRGLSERPVLHSALTEPEGMKGVVEGFLR